eukprot:TRINITY_DN16_c0_g2_i6.p1 TRINITY_DN16_c0_g2~~TRINITY_DN16_c0_g2_i6.p1  ORF type:complete len:216 (+),score=91.70 TRINITY_DN16_c0_g2_i6:62-709(+)
MMSKMLLLAATVALSEGVAIKWTGIVNDQQWSTANNWYPAQVPGPNDAVTIDDAEGKDAVVVLTSPNPVAIGSLMMGNSVTNNARLRVLAPLTVNNYATVQPNGVLEINSGAAGFSCGMVNVAGQLEFAAGTFVGNATITGLVNFTTQAAKVFQQAYVTVKSQQTIQAAGSLQFQGTSVINSNVGIKAIGQDFQCIVMDQSSGNGFHSTGFDWGN